MATVCETCGVVGYEHLLLSCGDCKCAMHQYCLLTVLFDASSLERWFCNECLPRHGEVTYKGSLHKASNRAHSGFLECHASTTSVESTKDSLLGPVVNKNNRRDCNAPSISCASGKALHSCEVKARKDENQQVDNEHSVRTMNNDCVANHLLARINKINLQKPLDEFEPSPGASEQLNPLQNSNSLSSGNVEIEYPQGSHVTPVLAGENQNEPSKLLDWADSSSLSETTSKQNILLEASDTAVELSGTVKDCVKDNPRRQRQLIMLDDDDDGEEAADVQSEDFNHRADSSSLSETTLKQNVLVEASDTAVELSDTVQNCVEDNPKKGRQLILLDDDDDDGEEAADVHSEDLNHRPDSSSLSETTLKQNVLVEASDTAVELSDTVQNCVEDNPRKRRKLILLDDSDDGEEAADVQSEDFNYRSLECDGSLRKHRIDTENCAEETVHAGDLNGQNLSAVQLHSLIPESSGITQPLKKRRRYTPANEDDEDGEVIIGTSNGFNDVSKLTSETLLAKDHALQSRIKIDSESANQQRCMYSQPIDEPIWSGILKINNEVFVSLVAHMSSKACGLVWELSTSLQPVVEVIKLPQLEAWPKSWKASGPTDGDIALYFFPPSMSPNEESDVLVEEIIDSGAAIKAVVGVAELLIFPSTILPEQYHVCRDKHYLWGVFKRREDESDKDVLVEEQYASARAKQREIQEDHFMDQQYEVQCGSPEHGSSVVKQLLEEHNCEAQDGATNATIGAGLASPDNNSSSVNLNPPEARSNYFMQPRCDPKPHVPEVVDHQEDEQNFTKPSADEQNFTKPSADLGPAAITGKSIDSAEDRAVSPTAQLFGFVAARTPRAQQLIQEMVSEGALLFSVAEEAVTFGSTVGNDAGAHLSSDADGESPPMQERCKSIGFVPLDDDDVASEALELFPVRQEHIGWTPRVEASKEVDLDLSLSARSGAPLESFL